MTYIILAVWIAVTKVRIIGDQI